ncbi:Cytochrome P450 4C1 [Cryptotermes secundus]|uniref:Cytochrome P450 4C1 n=1 Tax=Cryptotermes secundus TaxID=105785 RepID=A0A2J7QZN6_9NEOP|nr:Cytochrome P450 4C1 [Cryptotermes secundus]
MLILPLSIFMTTIFTILIIFRVKTRHMLKYSEKIPGPKTLPILGNALDFGLRHEDYLDRIIQLVKKHLPVVRVWIGPFLIIGVTDPKHIEAVMSSHKHIQKAYFYATLMPWLGTGLLTSWGKKWKVHRKILTPSFHFQILEKFIDVFNSNGDILVQRLSSHVNGPKFDITNYIVTCTLDVICESTMGVSVKAQSNGTTQYVNAVSRMGEIVMLRSLKPWLYPDTLFAATALKRLQTKCLNVLHRTTETVIRTRKLDLLAETRNKGAEQREEHVFGRKRHVNFLDLLIEVSSNSGAGLTELEIREEVDTFMFEGHDTTSSCSLFTLWALAKHQDVQERVLHELRTIFDNTDRKAKYEDLQAMKYLEQVIKESLRLYPSVPLFGRELTEDVLVDGYVFPAGSNVIFIPQMTHMNPDYFPDPEKFDPDRFLPENTVNRHPYCYIPFSAGPRNCIGQKFAMLEVKSLLSKLLRNYKFYLGDPEEKMKLNGELVLRSINGINLKLERRDW